MKKNIFFALIFTAQLAGAQVRPEIANPSSNAGGMAICSVEREELKLEVSHLIKDIRTCEEKYKSCEDKVNGLSLALRDCKKENASLSDMVNQLNEENQDLVTTINNLTEQNNELSSELSQCQEQANTLSGQLSQSQSDLSSCQSQAAILQAQLLQLQNQPVLSMFIDCNVSGQKVVSGVDANNNQVLDPNEISASLNLADCVENILGCTDPSASNYNPNATVDNNSCDYFDEGPYTEYINVPHLMGNFSIQTQAGNINFHEQNGFLQISNQTNGFYKITVNGNYNYAQEFCVFGICTYQPPVPQALSPTTLTGSGVIPLFDAGDDNEYTNFNLDVVIEAN